MGVYDRDYSHDGYDGGGNRPRMQFRMPALPPAVMWLLIVNTAIFVVMSLVKPVGELFTSMFSVFPVTWGHVLQVWRLVTYQFLHAGFMHFFFNMLMLFFFGPNLERLWGTKRFLVFYLTCGAAGGILYTLLVITGTLQPAFLVGASGSIYGIMAAMAILFPNIMIYVYGIIPVRLWVLAVIMVVFSFMSMGGPDNAGGHAAHFAGMAAGAAYVLVGPWKKKLSQVAEKPKQVKWEHKLNQQRNFQAEVDRILDKVHRDGIGSLTRKEKKTLQDASERQKNG